MKSAIISNLKLQKYHPVMFQSRIAVRKTSPRSVQKLSALHVRLSSSISTTSRTSTKLPAKDRHFPRSSSSNVYSSQFLNSRSGSRKTKMAPTNKSPASSLPSPSKPRLLIIGTGWAGWTLAQNLSSSPLSQTHTITVLSPYRTMALTPLLASAACGIFDFRIAEEPLRRLGNAGKVVKYQVHVSSVDLGKRVVRCRAAVGSNGDARLVGKKQAHFGAGE